MRREAMIAVILAGVIAAGCQGCSLLGNGGSREGDGAAGAAEQQSAQSGVPEADTSSAEEASGEGASEAASADVTKDNGGSGSSLEAVQRNVLMDLMGWVEDGGVRFEMDSSLPDGEIVSMTLTRGDFNTADCYQAGETIRVSEGKAVSSLFSNQGRPLSGDYDLALSVRIPEDLSLIIRSTNGEKSPSSIIIRASDVAEQLRKARAAAAAGQEGPPQDGQDGQGQQAGDGDGAPDGAGSAAGAEAAGSALGGDLLETDGVVVTALFSVSVRDRVTVKFSKDYRYTVFRTEAVEDPAGESAEETAQEDVSSQEEDWDEEQVSEESGEEEYTESGTEDDYIEEQGGDGDQGETEDGLVDEIVE